MRSRGSKPANLRTKKKTIKNVIVINGSPRTKWNTATLLEHALAGAASQGADTEHAHLYDLGYTGCTSYFACKLKGGKSYGKCAMKDGLTPALEKIAGADARILGSPVYFGTVTGMMRCFMKRLLSPVPRIHSAHFIKHYQEENPDAPIQYL